MRMFLAAVLALGAGCCWQVDQACVVSTPTGEACVDVGGGLVCLSDDETNEPPPDGGCADLRYGTCADLGFTFPCTGYSVRPGPGC